MKMTNEIQHEKHLKDIGRDKYDKEIRKAKERQYYSSTKPARHIIHERVRLFAETLKECTEHYLIQAGKSANVIGAKRLHPCIIELGGMGPKLDKDGAIIDDIGDGVYVVSMMAMKSIMDLFTGSYDSRLEKANAAKTVTKAANHIAEFIEAEYSYLQFINSEDVPDTVKSAGRRKMFDKHSTPKNKKGAPTMAMRKKLRKLDHPALQEDRFSQTDKANVGLFLLGIAARLDIVDWENVFDKKNHKTKLLYLKEFHDMVTNLQDVYQARAYVHEPMIEQPQQWEVSDEPSRLNTSGGYHWKKAKSKRPLCRSFYSDSNFGKEAVDTLNNLQETSYRICSPVLNVANQMLDKGNYQVGHFQCIPDPVEDLKPDNTLTDEEISERKFLKRLEHEKHMKDVKRHLRTHSVVEVANKYNDGREFYLGWSLDYRGRMYPLNTFLQIQGTDFEKSLICFSEGCELTDSALTWVKRAIGAAYLGTSDSYSVRERWTEDNQNLIRRIAEDPLGTIAEWSSAKEPWSFLQYCFEWHTVVMTKSRKLWYVPVGIDSTASGLQLLSAMRLDKQGMKYANLLKPEKDSDGPLDAYKAVLELARKKAVKDGKPHLIAYLQDRKVGKPALMLSIYGGSFLTIRDRIKEYFEEKNIPIEKESLKDVTKLVIQSSKDLFPAAYEALDWLTKLAVLASNRDERIQWSTPTGDLIDLTENEEVITQVRSEIMGRINISLGQGKNPDFNAMKNAFAPSMVHSWDASLCKAAFHNWHKPLALTHDCLKCLPADMESAVDKIKLAFKRVCANDPLTRLADELDPEGTIERLPQLGETNLLDSVFDSEYFFN